MAPGNLVRAALALLAVAASAVPAPVPCEEPAPPPAPAPVPIPAPAPVPSQEPPAAVVHGRPLARSAFYEALARRFLRGERGEKALEQILMDFAARREAAKRGVVVSDEEMARAVEDARRRVAEQAARTGRRLPPGRDPLAASLEEAGSSLAELLLQLRDILAIQKMAARDLGTKGEVPPAQVEVWLRELLAKAGAATDAESLAPGEVAKVGGAPVTWEQAGRWVARTLRREDRRGTAMDLCFALWVEDRAARQGAALVLEEVEGEVARLRRDFLRQPGIEGTGARFEDWLRDATGLTLAELRKDPQFLAGLLAKKLAAADIAPADVKKEWEANRDRYGETARVRRLVVHGEDRKTVFGASARPMAEARTICDRALEEIREGKSFETVARKYSEDYPADGPRGQPVDLARASRTTQAPQPVLDAVFQAKEGELLGPLRAADGWHLVLVEKRTPAPDFEQCAARVRDDMVGGRVRDWKVALRSDEGVRIAEDL
jgi:parvulin-like peptidyl-prolyl isomerase